MNGIWKAYKTFNFIKYIGVFISGISLLGMMFIISYDVFSRSLFSQSIRGGFEIIENYFLPLVVFPSLAYVYSSGVLPKMDLVLAKLKVKMRRIIIYLTLLLELFILVLIVQFSWEYAVTELGRKAAFPAGGTMYPLYPLFFLVPIAFSMIIIENIFVIIRNIEKGKPTLLVNNIDEQNDIET